MKKTITLDRVGRRNLLADGFILQHIAYAADAQTIHKAVFASLENKLGDHVRITGYGPCINGVAEDAAHYECDIEIRLSITDCDAVTLEVIKFCAMNGVPLVTEYFDHESKTVIQQRIF